MLCAPHWKSQELALAYQERACMGGVIRFRAQQLGSLPVAFRVIYITPIKPQVSQHALDGAPRDDGKARGAKNLCAVLTTSHYANLLFRTRFLQSLKTSRVVDR